jgi:hypothetical protein
MATPQAGVNRRNHLVSTSPDNTRFNGASLKWTSRSRERDLTVRRMTHCQSLTNR